MINKKTLQKAAKENIISEDQVDPLYQYIQQHESGSPATRVETSRNDNTEEPLKFIRSFGDVFITIGIVLLVIATNMINLSGYSYLIPVAGFVLIAEWLVHARKLALPGIALLLSILFFINKAISFDHENATTFGLAILGLSSLLFYIRYKMPFSLLPIAVSIVSIIFLQIGMDLIQEPIMFVGMGLIVFSVAMWFDSRDTQRKTYMSDNAFWLHLVAAPLIVHGAMISMLISDHQWLTPINKEILIILFFIGFFLIALFVDRRAMLISTQLYMIYALTKILNEQVTSAENILIYIFMALGFFVIFFGTYWYKTRRLIFGFLSKQKFCQYVPDFNIQDNKPS